MNNRFEYFGEENTKDILKSFSKTTGFSVAAINLLDEKFLSINESTFCDLVKSEEEGIKRCDETCKKACKEALKWKEPYFSTCHAGLVTWVIPIIIDEIPVGTIVSGKVIMWDKDEFFFNELKKNLNYIKDFEKLKKEASKLNFIDPKKVQSSADMLTVIINYCIKNENSIFTEQKNKMKLRNNIINGIHERKIEYKDIKFDYSVYLKREKRLLQYIRMANKEKISALLPMIFTDISMLSGYDIDTIRFRTIELISMVSRCSVEAGVENEVAIQALNEFHRKIYRYTEQDEIFLYVYDLISKIIENVYLTGKDKHTSLLKQAKYYIENNYSNEIKIDDVSEHILISSSYLSHLFKEKLNTTVHDYIIRVKIEKSIELMEKRELSIKDITSQVGFTSQSHYTRVFKKVIGVTPAHYRNKFL